MAEFKAMETPGLSQSPDPDLFKMLKVEHVRNHTNISQQRVRRGKDSSDRFQKQEAPHSVSLHAARENGIYTLYRLKSDF